MTVDFWWIIGGSYGGRCLLHRSGPDYLKTECLILLFMLIKTTLCPDTILGNLILFFLSKKDKILEEKFCVLSKYSVDV